MPQDRLTALDASFLQIEDEAVHMHVAAVSVFEGEPPQYDELLEAIERRLHLVPRYRQKLAIPWRGLFRPRWVDDPHLNLRYHVRATALPEPGGEDQLRTLAGRVFSQQLDRDKPLWEMWLVDRLEGGRFAVLSKTHHALVDGVSGVDIMSVLFDLDPEPPPMSPPDERWLPRPEPSGVELFGEAVAASATETLALATSVPALLRGPREALGRVREGLGGVATLAGLRLNPAPESIYNERIGPHRRFAWVRSSLDEVKATKNALGGTVNDVVLAAVSGALRRHLHRRGQKTTGMELKAMVPVSVRADTERGALGNKVTTMYAPLPVGIEDPVQRLETVTRSMRGLKESGQAVGAQVLTELGGFAPPTIMALGARQFTGASFFNLTVTNVPGPQYGLYLLGRRLLEIFPMVPLAPEHAVGVAIMSYDGQLDFGLVGDWDILYDLDDFAEDLESSLTELFDAAGVARRKRRFERRLSAPA